MEFLESIKGVLLALHLSLDNQEELEFVIGFFLVVGGLLHSAVLDENVG